MKWIGCYGVSVIFSLPLLHMFQHEWPSLCCNHVIFNKFLLSCSDILIYHTYIVYPLAISISMSHPWSKNRHFCHYMLAHVWYVIVFCWYQLKLGATLHINQWPWSKYVRDLENHPKAVSWKIEIYFCKWCALMFSVKWMWIMLRDQNMCSGSCSWFGPQHGNIIF